MSVLECDRRGCENIMCDWYSHEHGYLCNACRRELESAIYKMDISTFMGTDKGDSQLGSPKEDITVFEMRE